MTRVLARRMLLAGLLVFGACGASAANFVFTGASPSKTFDWSDPGNWSNNGMPNAGVPGPNDTATIGPGPFTVFVSTSVAVGKLVVTSGAQLIITGSLTVVSELDLAGLAPSQTAKVGGTGSLTLTKGATMYVAGTCGVSCSLTNNGLIKLLSASDDGPGNLSLLGTLLNAGTLQLDNSSAIVDGGLLINAGTILMNDPSTNPASIGKSESIPGPTLLNLGLVEVDNGTLSLWPLTANTNQGEYQANGVLQLHHTNDFLGGSTITGTGVCKSDGFVQLDGFGLNRIQVTGVFEMDSGTLAGENALAFYAPGQFLWEGGSLQTTCRINAGATALIDGPGGKTIDTNQGGLAVKAGSTVTWTGPSPILSATGSPGTNAQIANDGTFVAQNDAAMGVLFANGGTFRKESGSANAKTTLIAYQGFRSNVLVDQGTLSIGSGSMQNDNVKVETDGALLEFGGGTVAMYDGVHFSTTPGSGVDIHNGAVIKVGAGLLAPALIDFQGNLHFSGNQITGFGALVMESGQFFFEGGTISGVIPEVLTGTAMLITNGAGNGFRDCIVRNQGVVDIGVSFDLTDATFDNESGGTVVNTQSADITGTAGIVTNEGNWTVAAGTQEHIAPNVQNDGGTFQDAGNTYCIGGITCTAGSVVDLDTNANLTTQTFNLTSATLTGSSLPNFGVQGNLAADFGTISPGPSPGTLWVHGNYTSTPNTIVTIQLGGLTAGTQCDQVNITGTAALDGMLKVNLSTNLTPEEGDRFTILTYASHIGMFPVTSGLNLPNGLFLMPVYTATSLDLLATNITPIKPSLSIAPGPAGQGFRLTWPGVAGQSYQVETSPDMVHWYRAANLVGTGAPLIYTDSGPGATQAARFYRVR